MDRFGIALLISLQAEQDPLTSESDYPTNFFTHQNHIIL